MVSGILDVAALALKIIFISQTVLVSPATCSTDDPCASPSLFSNVDFVVGIVSWAIW